MGVGLVNKQGAIQRVDFRYNNNGTILSVDDCDVYTNRNGNIYKFPYPNKLLLNLDQDSFTTSIIPSASSFTTKDFTFTVKGARWERMGQIISGVTDYSSVRDHTIDTLNRTWVIPNSPRSCINLAEPVVSHDPSFSNQERFTIAMTFRLHGTPDKYRNMWVFSNTSDVLRLEVSSGGEFIYLYREDYTDTDRRKKLTFPKDEAHKDVNNNYLPHYIGNPDLTQWTQVIVSVSGMKYHVWVNGKQLKPTSSPIEGTITAMRQLSEANTDKFYIFTHRGVNSNLGFGCTAEIKHLAIWKGVTLNNDDVTDLNNFYGFTF